MILNVLFNPSVHYLEFLNWKAGSAHCCRPISGLKEKIILSFESGECGRLRASTYISEQGLAELFNQALDLVALKAVVSGAFSFFSKP